MLRTNTSVLVVEVPVDDVGGVGLEDDLVAVVGDLRVGGAAVSSCLAPTLATLTRLVVLSWRSRTKMSACPLVSPATRLLAEERNATQRPL